MTAAAAAEDVTRTARTLLEVQDVSVRYGGVQAVAGASLVIESPQTVGLIGPTGAGKSSLLAAIGGQADSASGRVLLAGEDVTRLPPHQRARLGIVRTFQTASVFDGLTVFENLIVAGAGEQGATFRGALLGGARSRAPEAAARERAEEVLREFEIWPIADHLGRELSGGQRRLVEIARCLMRSPQLLLLDEPMVGVAAHLVQRIGEHCQSICERGVAIVIVEHSMEVIRSICDRVVVMANGRVIDDGPYDRVMSSGSVKDAYLG
ncbi:MAG: ATP-binding cassette domain-containing protein [Solirubrobacteraceae bacterium]